MSVAELAFAGAPHPAAMPGAEKPENESDAARSAPRPQTEGANGPHTDRNPGTIPQDAPAATSGARPTSSAPPPTSSDTLLSLPTPASREDLAYSERLSTVERRIDEITRRVQKLERHGGNTGETPERARWTWLLFLVALALVWHVISFFR